MDGTRTAEALRALFGTGFFRDVQLERDGDTLVVSVVERPTIGSIEFSGNEELKTEDLLSALEQMGFAQGRVFNRSTFDQVKRSCTERTSRRASTPPDHGYRDAARTQPRRGQVRDLGRRRREDSPDQHRGKRRVDDDDLRDDFELDTTGFFSSSRARTDIPSRSSQPTWRRCVRSTSTRASSISASTRLRYPSRPTSRTSTSPSTSREGGRYVVRDVYLQGALIVPDEELFDLITVVQGEEFSRKHVTETARRIGNRLGTEGYSFANVNAVPEIDEAEKRVDLTFFVDPGKRVYVRRVNIKGNAKTRDEVLRREMRQMESGWISTELVERSRVRLNRLGFFESVTVDTPAVAGTSDQVDVDFTVVERPSGNLLLGAGYSDSQGVVFDISVTEENVLGGGNRLRASFNTSKVSRDISVSWLNPYWTVDGVSRGIDVYNRRTDAGDANLADYDLDQIGTGATFGIPISEFTRVNLGFNVEQTDFIVGPVPSDEVEAFELESGDRYITLLATGAWAKDSRNSRFLPTRGSLSRLSAEIAIPGSDLKYYKLFARHQRLFPLPDDFAFVLEGELGYGDGYGGTSALPLTENFFAGGLRSVRGFRANTLGPRDFPYNRPLGGNLKVVGTAELILPLPFTKDSNTFRVTTFLDAGNVYGPKEDFDFDMLRYSAGIAAIWLSPVGPLTMSFAKPLEKQEGDVTDGFQLTFGTSF